MKQQTVTIHDNGKFCIINKREHWMTTASAKRLAELASNGKWETRQRVRSCFGKAVEYTYLATY